MKMLLVSLLGVAVSFAVPMFAQEKRAVLASNPQSDAYTTTVAYVETFYPLWFTYHQTTLGNGNQLVGPERVSPVYHVVVAINDDTTYCSAYLNLTNEPLILTIPSTVSPDQCSGDTSVTYSILTLDAYCDVFSSSIVPIPSGPPPVAGGTYALTGPGWAGTLPPNVIPVPMPVSFPNLIFRIDKYHSFDPPDYVNQINQAELFRLLVRLQTLSEYMGCPHFGGRTLILPEIAFSIPFKTVADAEVANAPIAFLKQLQAAVVSPRTPQLTSHEQTLSDRFNELFGTGNVGSHSDFALGAQAAHSTILNNYLTHEAPKTNHWIHFTNIGSWNDENIDEAIDRSSITEFIQYANGITAAAYYHTFSDSVGNPLNGDNSHGYVMTFPPAPGGQPGPEASRFWSLTAYTPEAIELVPNPINKYLVASYTGAQLNNDGSLSVYMATKQPTGIPTENWLPIPKGPFNIMLRVYGVVPGSPVADNTYVPPVIAPAD
jgi:hypothetical protein